MFFRSNGSRDLRGPVGVGKAHGHLLVLLLVIVIGYRREIDHEHEHDYERRASELRYASLQAVIHRAMGA